MFRRRIVALVRCPNCHEARYVQHHQATRGGYGEPLEFCRCGDCGFIWPRETKPVAA